MSTHYLKPVFEPASIALFGASLKSDSVGGVLLSNLTDGSFKGPVFPINPKHDKLGEHPCYASILEVEAPVELAVIATPSQTIPGILKECGEKGVRAAVILSAGFSEAGPAGKALEEKTQQLAVQYQIRFIGPNCLGLMRPSIGLNATFFRGNALSGKVALVSQSGAICTSILDWAESNAVGFSSVISTGIAADLDFGEILDFLATDPKTECILLYIEGIKNARRFMSGLRAAARIKPVIALKAGRFSSGSEAAVSHTGALVGSDDVFDAALKRAGVVRVETTGQLFAAAETLSAGRRIQGDQIAIVTNGGGLGVLAADAASLLSVRLAPLEPDTMERLDKALPAAWSHANPVDILGDASSQRYQRALEACLADPNVDGVLVMLSPQAMTRPRDVARQVVKAYKTSKKPLIACWMGGAQTRKARDLFNRERVPCVDSPMTAMESFSYLIAHHKNQKVSLEVPGPLDRTIAPDTSGAEMICAGVLKDGRHVLTMHESKALLAAFRVPVTQSVLVRSPHEALICAEAMGFPVALKVNSSVLSHKTEIEGVRLNIQDAQQLLSSYQDILDRARALGVEGDVEGMTVEPMIRRPHTREFMIGVKRDPVFGPVISFGLGGTMVEVLKDSRVVLPPLNEKIIKRALAGTRSAKLLGPFRNLPAADKEAFVRVLRRVSVMVAELPWITEMDLNPVLVDEEGAIVVDARTVISAPGPLDEPYSHLAIHPYPAHLERVWQLPDGTEITIRPIRPEDAKIEDEFVSKLSERSKYFRFMGTLNELSPTMLVRFTQIDYDMEMAFIATISKEQREEEIAVGRYVAYPDGKTCEFAIAVADSWQGRGLGREIMVDLIRSARSRGLKEMRADILKNNESMVGLAKRLDFTIAPNPGDDSCLLAVKDLTTTRE